VALFYPFLGFGLLVELGEEIDDPSRTIPLALFVSVGVVALFYVALVAVLVGVVAVASGERKRVAGLLALGAASHLLADALLLKASGRSYPLLYPLTQYYPPTPGLYLSTDPWPSVVTGVVALAAWLLVRRTADRQNP
jgi:amino acid transporter